MTSGEIDIVVLLEYEKILSQPVEYSEKLFQLKMCGISFPSSS